MNELKLLKEQLNPHFLFNTLNNLYGLTLEKSDKAPDLVMRLSGILDYMLYRTNAGKVPLEQEVKMLKDYVSIEKYRFEGRYPIEFQIQGHIKNHEIAPLLLLPLVENCFKHGIRKAISGSFIFITLEVGSGKMIFKTRNSVAATESEGGIGITNLKKRLEMIYPGKHSLKIQKKEATYYTELTVHLEES